MQKLSLVTFQRSTSRLGIKICLQIQTFTFIQRKSMYMYYIYYTQFFLYVTNPNIKHNAQAVKIINRMETVTPNWWGMLPFSHIIGK